MYFVVCVVGACEFLYEPLWLCCVCCNTDCEWRKLIHMYRGGWAWTSVWTALAVLCVLQIQTVVLNEENFSTCIVVGGRGLLYEPLWLCRLACDNKLGKQASKKNVSIAHVYLLCTGSYCITHPSYPRRCEVHHFISLHIIFEAGHGRPVSLCTIFMRVFSVVWCTINCVVHH